MAGDSEDKDRFIMASGLIIGWVYIGK